MSSEQRLRVIDRTTRLARPATQDDIHYMEAICSAYDVLVSQLRQSVAQADDYKERVKNVYL